MTSIWFLAQQQLNLLSHLCAKKCIYFLKLDLFACVVFSVKGLVCLYTALDDNILFESGPVGFPHERTACESPLICLLLSA